MMKTKIPKLNYALIPMSEITDEARRIAVAWIDNYKPDGSIINLEQKQKLASDIMNYANEYSSIIAQEFAEWLEINHWWKSTDTRFPETLGRWTTNINGGVHISQTYTTAELYQMFLNEKLKEK